MIEREGVADLQRGSGHGHRAGELSRTSKVQPEEPGAHDPWWCGFVTHAGARSGREAWLRLLFRLWAHGNRARADHRPHESRDRIGKAQARYEKQASTGHAIPGVEIRVVDPEDNDVPRDGKSIGEIVARSDGVMAGYWKQPEATAEVMRDGWFHTGDMATMDEDGYVLIVDRKKDIIVSGGENISSLEVEKAMLAHPGIYEVAVIPVPDERWGEVPKALVVMKPGVTATESEILEFCRGRLTHYKCPRSVEFHGCAAADRHRQGPEKRAAQEILVRNGKHSSGVGDEEVNSPRRPESSERTLTDRTRQRIHRTAASQILVDPEPLTCFRR